jgi:cytochrome c oxidase assembly factor CtaG
MKLGFLAVDIPVGTLLGLALTQATTSAAPSFHTLADTQQGGGLLWIASELFTFAAIAIVVFQWMRSDTREAVRGDRRADADYATRWAAQAEDPDVARVGADLELTEVEVVDGRFVHVSHPGPVAGDR